MEAKDVIEMVQDILDQEEWHTLSLLEASEKLDTSMKEIVQANAKGARMYYQRIRERIEKEIINAFNICNAVDNSTDKLSG